jgi:Emfourin
MKIYFEQTGGLIGIDLHISLDSNCLPPEELQKLHSLVDNADFFALSSELAASPKYGADYFQYNITIEVEGLKHSVKTTDITMPPNLAPLVRYLRQKVQVTKKE